MLGIDDLVDNRPGDPTNGNYRLAESNPFSYSLDIGGYAVTEDAWVDFQTYRKLNIYDDWHNIPSPSVLHDSWGLETSLDGPLLNGHVPTRAHFGLWERISGTFNPLSSILPPPSEIMEFPISAGDGVNWMHFEFGADVQRIHWTLSSFTVVPEPGSASLLGMGLVALGLHRRRHWPGTHQHSSQQASSTS